MSVSTVSTFFAVTALILAATVVIVAVVGVASRWSNRGRAMLDVITISVGPQALWLAFGVALAATLGSLYYSEVARFEPCEYCWYQRIAMYPLTLTLGVAAARKARGIGPYVLPAASIGGLIAAYHYLIQHVPSLSADTCSITSPCTAAWVWEFDFVSIPFMALVSFSLIVTLVVLDGRFRRMADEAPPNPDHEPLEQHR